MANFDAAELKKFDDVAQDWWNPKGELWTLHAINPIRMDFIRNLAGPLAGKTALDLGCGGGLLSESLAIEKAQVTGIDLSQGPLQVASQHASQQGLTIRYQCMSAEDHALKHPHAYDLVNCLEMLEHVPDPASIIQATAALVKPNGWVFISTLNRNTKSWLMAIGAVEHLLKWLPKGTHQHSKFLKPSEITDMARQVGLHLKASSGIVFNPLTQSFQLKAHDLDVNYILAFQKEAS